MTGKRNDLETLAGTHEFPHENALYTALPWAERFSGQSCHAGNQAAFTGIEDGFCCDNLESTSVADEQAGQFLVFSMDEPDGVALKQEIDIGIEHFLFEQAFDSGRARVVSQAKCRRGIVKVQSGTEVFAQIGIRREQKNGIPLVFQLDCCVDRSTAAANDNKVNMFDDGYLDFHGVCVGGV